MRAASGSTNTTTPRGSEITAPPARVVRAPGADHRVPAPRAAPATRRRRRDPTAAAPRRCPAAPAARPWRRSRRARRRTGVPPLGTPCELLTGLEVEGGSPSSGGGVPPHLDR